MAFKTLLKDTKNKLRKLKNSRPAILNESNATVDDPEMPPRLRLLTTPHTSPAAPTSDTRAKRLRASLRHVKAKCSIKQSKGSKPVVTPPTTSALPERVKRSPKAASPQERGSQCQCEGDACQCERGVVNTPATASLASQTGAAVEQNGAQAEPHANPSEQAAEQISEGPQLAAMTESHRAELVKLKAAHRLEVERLRAANRGNLEIWAGDLRDEKAKTRTANGRAARSTKQLQASRAERQQATRDLAAQIRRADDIQNDADRWNAQQLNEILRLNQMLAQSEIERDQSNAANQDLQQNLNTSVKQAQALSQHLREQLQKVNVLKATVTTRDQHMNIALQIKDQALTAKDHAEAKLEEQKTINQALLQQRADDYVELPQDADLWRAMTFRPDQYRDVEQALMVSQNQLQKAEEKLTTIGNDMVDERLAREAAEKEHEHTLALQQRYQYAFLNKRKYEAAMYTILVRTSQGEEKETSEQLRIATVTALSIEKSLRNFIGDLMKENMELRSLKLASDKERARIIQDYESAFETARLQNENLHGETVSLAGEIGDLKKIALLYRAARKDVNHLQEQIQDLLRALEQKAIKPIETELWNRLNLRIATLEVQNQTLEHVTVDQQLHINKLRDDVTHAENQYRQRFAEPMAVFFARDRYHAMLKALLSRYHDHLMMHPIDVDVTPFMTLLSSHEREEFLQFPDHLCHTTSPSLHTQANVPSHTWMRVVYDISRLANGQPHTTALNISAPLMEKIRAAVENAANDRRIKEIEAMRGDQHDADVYEAMLEEQDRMMKEEGYVQREEETRQVREETEAVDEELRVLLPRLRQRKDWDGMDPEDADAEWEEEAEESGSTYEEDYDVGEEPEQEEQEGDEEEQQQGAPPMGPRTRGFTVPDGSEDSFDRDPDIF